MFFTGKPYVESFWDGSSNVFHNWMKQLADGGMASVFTTKITWFVIVEKE